MKLAEQIYAEFDGYLEILLGVLGRDSSLRVCVRVDETLKKKQALHQAATRLPVLLANLPEVERIAQAEGTKRFADYCTKNNLSYKPPSVWGIWINPDGSASFECGFYDDLDGEFIQVACSARDELTLES
jgi:hypothetical protein